MAILRMYMAVCCWLLFSVSFVLAGPAKEDNKKLPVEHRTGLSEPLPPGVPPMPGGVVGPNDLWPQSRSDMPQIKTLNVLCEKNFMKVSIEFDRPFYGLIFSKGHYSDAPCVHLKPGSGFITANFDVFLNNCGTTSSAGDVASYNHPFPANAFIENTIIVQYDPLVQEVWDQARKLRCTWFDYYEKTVTFKPFNVDVLRATEANFLGDNIQCWMQIQVGKGPWAKEVSGIVKIGQTMTMVLAIKDDENKFDMLVKNCVAHDGKRPAIQLVDDFGCVVRPKVMSPFQKAKNFETSASVVSYAYFQAFKFPDSMNVFFQCEIQVCRHECPEPVCGGAGVGLDYVDPRVVAAAAASNHREQVVVPAPGELISSSNSVNNQPLPPQPPGKPQIILPQHPRPPNKPINNVPQPLVRVPFPVPLNPGYINVGRDGVANISGSYPTSNSMNGRPRAANLNKQFNGSSDKEVGRRRRAATPEAEDVDMSKERMDIPTAARAIQVVAPGDVAFSLGTGNETVVIANSAFDLERSAVCMSMPSFVSGLAILLSILTAACIVAAFLYIRIRSYHRKSLGHYSEGYDNPEYVKPSATK